MSTTWPTEFFCLDCGRDVPITVCQSDKHGNAGRLMAMCKLLNKNAPSGRCNFIRWASDRVLQTSSAPAMPSLPAVPLPPSPSRSAPIPSTSTFGSFGAHLPSRKGKEKARDSVGTFEYPAGPSGAMKRYPPPDAAPISYMSTFGSFGARLPSHEGKERAQDSTETFEYPAGPGGAMKTFWRYPPPDTDSVLSLDWLATMRAVDLEWELPLDAMGFRTVEEGLGNRNTARLPSLMEDEDEDVSAIADRRDMLPTAARTPDCAVALCTFKRIHPQCERKSCRKHCMLAGGCTVKKHRVPGSSYINPPTSEPPSRLPPVTQPVLTAASSSATSTAAAAPAAVLTTTLPVPSVDPRPDPRFISHMPAVFMDQWAIEQGLHETKRRTDEEQKLNEAKAKRSVEVFAWAANNTEAVVATFQDGYTPPNFKIDANILINVGLPLAAHAGAIPASSFMLLNNYGIWTRVQKDHVVVVKEDTRIFLKAINVNISSCTDFERYHKVAQVQPSLHLRYGTPYERSSVRKQNANILHQLSPTDISSDDDDELPVAPLKRKRAAEESDSGKSSHGLCSSLSLFSGIARPSSSSTRLSSAAPSSSARVLSAVPEQMKVDPELEDETLVSVLDLTEHGSFADDPIDVDEIKVWPSDFYAVDVVAVFAACDRSKGAKVTVADTFQAIVGHKYRSSTYSSQRNRWTDATQAERDKALAGGCGPAGLWSLFMKTNPARGAAEKAAKKRAKLTK